MAEHDDNLPKFSSHEPVTPTEPSTSKPRKKRKWDQPDKCLIPSGVITSGLLSVPTIGYPSVCLPGIMPTRALTQTPLMQLQAAAVAQKLIQPKIQEDLVIAREIVINDADSAMRYKLTKRQTQEEIQKCTGAVVITRGKYRPPNAAPDGEKPLYLHISSGAHLKETAERVVAVDRAAAMIEDMLKQVTQPLSTCVYVGFDADPSLNIVARIRGPNDQYINHIINETGATIVLRGDRSEYVSSADCEEGQQPLHLFLSSNNQKSLEDARLLAENLMDTISRECVATRVTSSKLYGAVPPPRQLLVGVQSSGLEMCSNLISDGSLVCSATTAIPGMSNSLVVAPAVTAAVPFGQGAQTGPLLPSSCSQTNRALYSQPLSSSITSYSSYTGIYPQAMPLPQVALGVKQSITAISTVAPATLSTGMTCKSSSNAEHRPSHKRKFQEAPTTLLVAAGSQQCPALHAPMKCSSSVEKKIDTSSVSSTSSPSSRSMPPSPPPLPSKFPPSTLSLTSRSMLPPKATSSVTGISINTKDNISTTGNPSPVPVPVPDTLVKLMEYGDDDDDDDDDNESDENELETLKTNPNQSANTKPFWAA